ncbi:MAG: hypothetical protein K1060chlam2_01000 [Chlamydiae bacterium]|nr:hypothetical protein [Chlamydiota bacterium]
MSSVRIQNNPEEYAELIKLMTNNGIDKASEGIETVLESSAEGAPASSAFASIPLKAVVKDMPGASIYNYVIDKAGQFAAEAIKKDIKEKIPGCVRRSNTATKTAVNASVEKVIQGCRNSSKQD